MRNLFIVHSQYCLILATGLSVTEFEGDDNDLILFTDFDLNDSLNSVLANSYNQYMRMDSIIYPKREVSAKEKFYKVTNDNKKIKRFIVNADSAYDRLFVVCSGNIQEQYAMKCAYKRNNQVDMIWLEDGTEAYTDGIFSVVGGMGSTPLKRFIRKISAISLYGLRRFYDLPKCMGTHRMLKKAYLIYPDMVKSEYRDFERIGITQQAFSNGVNILYEKNSYVFDQGGVLFILEKLDGYGELKSNLNELIARELKNAKAKNRTVYYKYHPRESETLPALEGSIELDKSTALEGYLLNSQDKDLEIIGVKSTALYTIKKMGYNTMSLIKYLEPDNNEMIQFLEKAGIRCPKEEKYESS